MSLIEQKIVPQIRVEESVDSDYVHFCNEFEKLTHIILNLYKSKQMKRRIDTLIQRKKVDGYDSFLRLLCNNSNELSDFLDYITINVTEFFRTPNQWEIFENTVLAQQIGRENETSVIWSCACSTGEEPYSLSMSLLCLDKDCDFKIIASDVDENVLKKARSGIYDEKYMDSLPSSKKERFFLPVDSKLKVNDEVREHVEFRRLDLLQDEYPTNCDVIVCRNVLIYFTEEGKNKIYKKIHESLKPGGYLFTGNAEQIIYYKAYGFKKITNFIYQKEY